jgi:hypothetical protein
MPQRVLPVTPLEQFIDLFRGRGDCYGSWDGGCVRNPLTPDTFKRHLDGTEKIGVYPIVPTPNGDMTIWGCIDIDTDDLDGARNLQTILKARNILTWVERTRKGYHVWCFADRLLPAATMRRALLAAHQVLDYPAKEVNPKQEQLAAGKVGNYVRLPYYGPQEGVPVDRYIMDDNDNPLYLGQFLAVVRKTKVADIEQTAAMWVAPPVTEFTGGHSVWGQDTSAIITPLMQSDRVSGTAHMIWKRGPMPDNPDRSNALVRLAAHLRESDVPIEHAWLVLIDADRRWGKFHSRFDGEHQLRRILEYGYRGK